MAFPNTPLQIHTELMLDGAWTEVSGDVNNREAMTIKHGAADQGARADTSSLSFQLNNRDGAYSPRNPRSPLYGKIGRNTPVRVGVDAGESYLSLDGDPANFASTPDAANLSLSTGLDLAAEVSIDWRRESGNQILIGKWETAGDQRSYMLRVFFNPNDNHKIALTWTSAGTAATTGTFFFNVSFPPERFAVRMTMDTTSGIVNFYTAPHLGDPWTLRGSADAGGPFTIFDGTAPLRVAPNGQENIPPRNPFIGKGHRFQVRNGVGGAIVANPDFTVQPAGTTSFADSAGKTWTLGGAATITNRHVRFEGEISAWPSRWTTDGNDVWVPIEAAGIRRRLGQGAKALDSTLRRRIPSGSPVAYWPMEEDQNATQMFPGISSGNAITPTGISFAADDTLLGSLQAPRVGTNGGTFTANVPVYSGNGYHVEMPFFLPTLPASEQEFIRLTLSGAGGSVAFVSARVSTAGIRVGAYESDGTLIVSFLNTDPAAIAEFAGDWNRLQFFSTQDGTNTYLNLRWRDVVGNTFFAARTVYTGTAGSMGRVTRVSASWGTAFSDLAFGHLGVFGNGGTVAAGGAIGTTVPGTFIYEGADDGFLGERVPARVERLSLEQSVPYKINAFVTAEQMGSQRPETYLSLLDRAEAVNMGLLYDSREGRAVEYRARASVYTQDPRLELDYASQREVAPPLEPTEDDDATRNDITRSRIGGASYRVTQESGALSVQAPPLGVGIYDEQLDLSVYADTQLPGLAEWALHLGTWDEARYPVLNMRLHGAPHLIPTVLELLLLDRVDILNPPEWLPPGPLRLLVQGYEEQLTITSWELSLNCSPYGPWEVGVVEDTTLGRADTSSAVLAEALTDTDTTVDVYTPVGQRWIDTANFASQFPFDVTAGGEQMTVTAISDMVSDTFTRTSTDTWGTSSSGQAWTNSGGTAADYDVVGTYGRHVLPTLNATRRSTFPNTYTDTGVVVDVTTNVLATGASIIGGPTLRQVDPDNLYTARLAFNTANTITLSLRSRVAAVETQLATVDLPGVTHVAGTFIRVRFEVQGSELRASAWVASASEPSYWMLRVTNTSVTTSVSTGLRSAASTGNTSVAPEVRYDNYSLYNPQRFTVVRSVNAVVKSQTAGTPISLTYPMRAAL